MKRTVLLLVMAIGHFSAYCQTDIYDGDWYYSYNDVCGIEYQDGNENTPVRRGDGKDVYRIRTENGNTTVRVKRQYPCDSYFEYWECNVTQCDDYCLEWNSEINRYSDPDNPSNTIVVVYYCRLRKDNSMLIAEKYCRSRTINRNGYVVDSTTHAEGRFHLYKDGNDW